MRQVKTPEVALEEDHHVEGRVSIGEFTARALMKGRGAIKLRNKHHVVRYPALAGSDAADLGEPLTVELAIT